MHLDTLPLAEDWRVGVEVVGPSWIGSASDIDHQISRPAED